MPVKATNTVPVKIKTIPAGLLREESKSDSSQGISRAGSATKMTPVMLIAKMITFQVVSCCPKNATSMKSPKMGAREVKMVAKWTSNLGMAEKRIREVTPAMTDRTMSMRETRRPWIW